MVARLNMAFNQATADRICDLLAEGKSLRETAKTIGMSASAILDWTTANPEFGERYARVRARAYQMLAEEIIEISDDSQYDTYLDADGNQRINTEVVARSKLRVDSRKWILAKMLPKTYGDKIETTHKGSVT